MAEVDEAQMLTAMVCKRIIEGEEPTEKEMTVQVMSIEEVGGKRLKVSLSDGNVTVGGVINPSQDHTALFESKELKAFSVIKCTGVSVIVNQGKNLALMQGVSVISNPGRSLGPATPSPAGPPAKKARLEGNTPTSGGNQGTPGSLPRASQGSRRVVPLLALNPYNGGWTLRVRANCKSALRTCKTKRGDLSVFDVELTDEQNTTVRTTAWGEVAERLSGMMQDGRAYYVSGGQLKPANKQYNSTGFDYELTLNERSVVEEAADAENMKIDVKWDFVGIDQLAGRLGGAARPTVDVLGIATRVSDIQTVNRKAGADESKPPMVKRDVTLLDASSKTVSLTLWNDVAEGLGAELAQKPGALVALKSVSVGDYGGVSLSTIRRTQLLIDPELPEAAALLSWYHSGGSSAPTTEAGAGLASSARGAEGGASSGGRSTFAELGCGSDEVPAPGAKPLWGQCLATVMLVKSDNTLYYTACPGTKNAACKKKVTQEGDQWRCESCADTFPSCVRRYIFSVKAADCSGPCWVQTFNEQGEQVLRGLSADGLHELKDRGDGAFEAACKAAQWQTWSMKVKSTVEVYNGESRRRHVGVSLQKPDYAHESRQLLAALKASGMAF